MPTTPEAIINAAATRAAGLTAPVVIQAAQAIEAAAAVEAHAIATPLMRARVRMLEAFVQHLSALCASRWEGEGK